MSNAVTVWLAPEPLLLASTSPARRVLLEGAAIPVDTEAPGVDERTVEAAAAAERLAPEGVAALLAREKALAVSHRRPGRLVLGADQTLACDGRLFHKPASRTEAEAHLAALSGRTHELHSAAALARDSRIVAEIADGARLAMRPLGSEAVRHYLDLAGDDALRSVGAYRVEGLGLHLFAKIQGDHATILGLPLLGLLAALREQGCLAF